MKKTTQNKTTIIQKLNEQIETQSIKSITEVVNMFLDLLVETLQNNERVNISGIFSMDTVFTKGRSGTMFKTKTPFSTNDRYTPRVKFSRLLKNKVAQNEKS